MSFDELHNNLQNSPFDLEGYFCLIIEQAKLSTTQTSRKSSLLFRNKLRDFFRVFQVPLSLTYHKLFHKPPKTSEATHS
jgi:hypothetical protein